MLHTTRSARRIRSSSARLMMEALDSRELMSVTMPTVTPAAPVQAAPAPVVTVTTLVPLVNANVRVGVDNNGNLQVAAYGAYSVTTGQPTAPANIVLYMYHDSSRGGADVSISAGGMNVVLPVASYSGITVTDTTGGTINFSAPDTQLLADYVPFVNLTSNGSVYLTSVVPVNATGNYVNEGDTGFFNPRDNLTGHTVISVPGGANLFAVGTVATLVSSGPINSTFFGDSGGTSVICGGNANNIAYLGAGDSASFGTGNNTVNVNSYGTTFDPSNIYFGGGSNQVNVRGDLNALVTINQSGGSVYVQQFTSVRYLGVMAYSGGTGTLVRDNSLMGDPNYNLLNSVLYYADLNTVGGKG